jgi:hypothetical protein
MQACWFQTAVILSPKCKQFVAKMQAFSCQTAAILKKSPFNAKIVVIWASKFRYYN